MKIIEENNKIEKLEEIEGEAGGDDAGFGDAGGEEAGGGEEVDVTVDDTTDVEVEA